jgi:6-phosphogluconate dehydrogenase
MPEQQLTGTYDIGWIGLGVMGRNFALNLADHRFAVACHDRDPRQADRLQKEKSGRHAIAAAGDLPAFCRLLRRPRAVLLLVPAGKPVEMVIQALEPLLETGDLIIDSGNSHFSDTDRRIARLAQKGLHFMGMGMSGGARGARQGPSLMPGGPEEGYERVRPVLQAAAAQTGAGACVAWMGHGSAGHYVKMVHNGIEYSLMQLIAETYDLMKRGLGLRPDELQRVYERWNRGGLNSYLIEITAAVLGQKDERSGGPLIDRILDAAKQKGTGQWTVADALQLQVPVPSIAAAVMMRHLSADKAQREETARMLEGPRAVFRGDPPILIDSLENALHAGFLITFAQGLALLRQASRIYGYQLNRETVARVWTGGCIIRAAMLEPIRAACVRHPEMPGLLTDPELGRQMQTRQSHLREVVRTAAEMELPAPGLMAALAYWDAARSGWLPANLIMAQRDYFGAHTYERIDAPGTFHTQWDAT